MSFLSFCFSPSLRWLIFIRCAKCCGLFTDMRVCDAIKIVCRNVGIMRFQWTFNIKESNYKQTNLRKIKRIERKIANNEKGSFSFNQRRIESLHTKKQVQIVSDAVFLCFYSTKLCGWWVFWHSHLTHTKTRARARTQCILRIWTYSTDSSRSKRIT